MRFSRKKPIDWESHEYKRARFHYLLQILYGESLATDYCLAMSAFAPTPEARNFLLQQQKEEAAHLELLSDMVSTMERPPERISVHMNRMHRYMEAALREKDWPAAVFIQNFIVEGLAVSLSEQQGKYGDASVHRVFETILRDEARHVAFGVAELRKLLERDADGAIRRRLVRIQRKTLYQAIMLFKDLAPDAKELGMRWDDLAEKVVRDHVARITAAGMVLPVFDRLFLKAAVAFFVII